MTEVSISARCTWTGADFAITVDQVADDENAYLSDRDIGAKVVESLRARGYHVVDNRAAYHEALRAMGEETDEEPEVEPELGTVITTEPKTTLNPEPFQKLNVPTPTDATVTPKPVPSLSL